MNAYIYDQIPIRYSQSNHSQMQMWEIAGQAEEVHQEDELQ